MLAKLAWLNLVNYYKGISFFVLAQFILIGTNRL